MRPFDHLTETIREPFDSPTEGWQQLWSKARNSITRFKPGEDEDIEQGEKDQHPLAERGARWGLLSAEIRELEDAIEVEIEAPGMSSDDSDISLRGHSLVVSGHKRYASDRREGQFHVTERAYGQFQRILPLPVEVEDEHSTARYAKGVLTIRMVRKEPSRVRRITVN